MLKFVLSLTILEQDILHCKLELSILLLASATYG